MYKYIERALEHAKQITHYAERGYPGNAFAQANYHFRELLATEVKAASAHRADVVRTIWGIIADVAPLMAKARELDRAAPPQ